MSFQGTDQDRYLLSLPSTPPEELARIASARPDLWAEIQGHPNVYPELVEWMVASSAQSQVPNSALGAGGASTVDMSGHVPAGSPAAQPVATPRKKKRDVKTALIIGVSAFVVAAILGVGAWFLFGKEKEEQSTVYGSLPVVSSAATIGSPDTPIHLIPIGQAGYVNADNLVVAASDVGGQQMLVGVEEGSVGAPAWTATVSGPLSECAFQSGSLRCGAQTVDVKSGAVTEGAAASSSESTREDANEDQVGEEQAGEDQGAEGAQAERDKARQTPQAPSDADYTMEGTDLLDKKGEVLTTFGSTPVWQQSSSGGVFIFSDGSKVAAVKGTKLLWEVELEDGSKEVNLAEGSEAPFDADSQTVVVGEPTGILGLDVGTGEETWNLEAPVDTWFASGETLMVGSEGAIYQLSFPTDGEEAETGSEELVKLEQPEGVAWEVLADASLMVPDGCVGAGSPLQFSGGEAAGTSLDVVEPMMVGGEAFGVAQLMCTTAQGDYALYWAIYDADANLVAGGALDEVPGFGQYEIPYYAFEEPLAVAGTQFTYTLKDVELTQGSTDVTVTHGFNGSEVSVDDVVYLMANGETRAPKLDEVQALYDAIAAGQEDSVAGQISAQELDAIKTGILGDGMDGVSNYRKYLYPVGGKISSCVLSTPAYLQGLPITDDLGVTFYATDKDYGVSRHEPGVWLCGIETPLGDYGSGGLADWGSGPMYLQNLRVTTDAEGTPTIVGTDRTFS